MGYRRKAREMALQILFQGEHFPERSEEQLRSQFSSSFTVEDNIEKFGFDLYDGVRKKDKELNNLIERYSEHWKMSRMSFVDRNILRIALYEMFYIEDIPASVSIDEAIEIAKRYGSKDSASFVNGILDKIFKEEILAA